MKAVRDSFVFFASAQNRKDEVGIHPRTFFQHRLEHHKNSYEMRQTNPSQMGRRGPHLGGLGALWAILGFGGPHFESYFLVELLLSLREFGRNCHTYDLQK